MKPLGPPPRIFGMKITSNRIEAFFVLFATVVLFLIFLQIILIKLVRSYCLSVLHGFCIYGLSKNQKDHTN